MTGKTAVAPPCHRKGCVRSIIVPAGDVTSPPTQQKFTNRLKLLSLVQNKGMMIPGLSTGIAGKKCLS